MANSDAGTSSDKAGGGQYQVFLNFCGQDTRDGFTDFLYQDLVENCIHVFMDDEELPVGEEIGGELLQAIDNSQIYIPIFSRNYASSKWCLRELARMVHNASKSEEKKILPIFYNVEPKDVDLKTPLYRTAIEKHKEEHKEKFPGEGEYWEGESWEDALKKVDKIKGWELKKCKSKAELMKLAVKGVLHRLKRKHKIVTKDLVGLDDRVAEVLELLDVNCSDEVRLLKVHGMGGIGKTTLAGVVYNELCSSFGKCCAFLDNIRETSKKEGLLWLQKKLLSEIANSSSAEIIKGVDDGRERIEETLGSKKVLIVLDDVDEEEQIKNLIGQRRLHPGTRVIITTRIISVLEFIEQRIARERKEMNSDNALQIQPYEMKEMNFDDSLQLFKRHAFVDNSKANDFDSLSRDIVNTTGFLPLAIEVIGSLLFGKLKAKWEDTLKRLKKMPHKRVQEKLMISYEALNYRQREIFLDVACFFINEDMMNAKYMWEACGFDPTSEINVLVEMSLIKIKDNDKFWMHDQLRELGREIVRQENPKNLEKQSRVWTSEEFLDFGYEDVEALDLGWMSSISISHEEIGRFKSLRFLRLSNGSICGDLTVSLPKLRWISWSSWSQGGIGPSMHSKNLVVLELFENRFLDDLRVWDLIKMTTKLKNLTLVKCVGITRTPNLSKCLDLERLTFNDCQSLKEIDDSIGKLKYLLDLNITHCGLIERVPDEIGGLVKLERFSLSGCSKVKELPTSIGDLASLRKLDLSFTRITSLPESIGDLASLKELNLSITKISSLPELVGEIPDERGDLSSLRVLHLSFTRIYRVPETIIRLSHLSTLDLTGCDKITKLPELPASLVHLRVTSRSLQVVPNLSKLADLVELVLSDGYGDEDSSNLKHTCDLGWIGRLSKLKKLKLCLLNIAAPPTELGSLSLLEDLTLFGLDLQPLQQLPPSLHSLELDNFSSTGPPHSNLEIPSKVTLRHSRLQEIQLYGLSQLQHLVLDKCDLRSISIPSSLRKLKVKDCPNMIEIQVLGMSASLEHLKINECRSFGRIVLCGEGGSLEVLDQLGPSSNESTNCSLGVLLLPNSLKKLKRLDLLSCKNLVEIQVIGTLLSLQHMQIQGCIDLRSISIPSSLRELDVLVCTNTIEIQVLGMLASLECLSIFECWSFGRTVLCGEGGSLGVLDQSESSLSESNDCSPRVLLHNALEKLETLFLYNCKNLLEIQVIGTLLSLKCIQIQGCVAMEKLTGISNSKNLSRLDISYCVKLQVVEGLDKLEFLTELNVNNCPSLETLLDISKSKISDECQIQIYYCKNLPNSSPGYFPFKRYKEKMVQQGAPQSEINKEEAKMKGDAVESDTEIQSPFHSSASSWDHEISEEPSFDNVREGTPSEKQNQTMGEDSNRLDALAPPRTFCDRFKTCLASILECVCNRNFPSIKVEIL